MAQAPKAANRIVAIQVALVLLWIAAAAAISYAALHLAVTGVRASDLLLAETAATATRIAEGMGERGRSNADIATAISTMAKERGLDATINKFPGDHPPEGPPGRRMPFEFMLLLPGMPTAPGLSNAPTAMVHVPGGMVLLRLQENPLTPIAEGYAIAMGILLSIALIVTWIVQSRLIRRALAPVATVEGALRRLAGGEYARLEMVGHEPDEAAVVDAYNAAADELASSIRRRAEAESNLRQFVAEAGHELRTPLTVIMGFVDVLRQGAIAEQALAQRILEAVAGEGERMRLLIAKLLLLARLDAVAPERNETVDLSGLVVETVDSLRPVAGAAHLSVSVEPGVWVFGSGSELREVVGNLVDNALKYAPSSNVRAELTRNGRFAELSVQDDGPGMAAALRDRAFDRFSRGDDRGSVPGSGLGLAIVKRIANRSGGDVDLESAPGKGTRVRVRVPLATPQSDSSPRNV